MKIWEKLLKWGIIVIGLIFITELGLYIYKYYSIKDINESYEENYNMKELKHKGKIFRYGSKGEYPILEISTDNKNWKTINIRGLLYDAIPTNTEYYGIESIQNTIWFKELKWCIECDCGSKIYNFYYSHDNGTTWRKSILPNSTCSTLEFYNDKDGILMYDEGSMLITKDGGKTWQKK